MSLGLGGVDYGSDLGRPVDVNKPKLAGGS